MAALHSVSSVVCWHGSARQAIGRAKGLRLSRWWRIALSATGMIVLAPIALWWFDAPLHLGPSYAAIEWAAQPDRTIAVLCGLFAVRAASTWLGVAGGGMGGLFIPLVTQGAIVGSIFEHVVDSPNPHLFPTIGIAAFLGAGYRTPLAGVAFVAEATGEPGFLVPALLAAAAAQLVMGAKSFSTYQRNERLPDVEPLSRLAVADIMSPSADTIDGELDLEAVVSTMLRQNRRWAPVVDDSGYVGLIAVTDISLVPFAEWSNVTARDIARTDVAPAAPADTVEVVADRLPRLEQRSHRSHDIQQGDRGHHVTRPHQHRGAPRPIEQRVVMTFFSPRLLIGVAQVVP